MAKPPSDWFDVLGAVVAGLSLALIVIIFVLLAIGQTECSSAGGVYVRGVFWFECVGRWEK